MKTAIRIISLITTAWLFATCSNDSELERNVDVVPEAELTDATLHMVGLTRVALGSTDFGDIRVLLNDGTNTSLGVFVYDGVSEWTTRLKLKSGTQTYRTYGYMPDNAAMSGSITSINADKAVMRIQGLTPATASQDYCVITGVRQVENEEDLTSATRGSFSFEYASNRENYINLLFDHLYAHIVFKMKVHNDYAALRSIKVKSMRLQLPSISQASADITLTNGLGIESVSYAVTGTDNITLDIRTTEQTLSTTAVEIANAYLAPSSMITSTLVLVTEYDVYDRKGNKIAERTATNKLSKPLLTLTPGEDRTLNLTVEPSYLHLLSEEDMDNPTIVVN